MGMAGNGNGNGFMGMGGNGNRNSPPRTPLHYINLPIGLISVSPAGNSIHVTWQRLISGHGDCEFPTDVEVVLITRQPTLDVHAIHRLRTQIFHLHLCIPTLSYITTHINVAFCFNPIYSDTTQLNSMFSWVECRYKWGFRETTTTIICPRILFY